VDPSLVKNPQKLPQIDCERYHSETQLKHTGQLLVKANILFQTRALVKKKIFFPKYFGKQ
jgi:hypothetical protein